MSCTHCATGAISRAAAARCRYCELAVCSEHLGQVIGRRREQGSGECGHLFLAVGWLAGAVGSSAGAVARLQP